MVTMRKQLNREQRFHQALIELELARPVNHWTLFDGQRKRANKEAPDRKVEGDAVLRSCEKKNRKR